ncbi:MAG: AraC family transcriptional regulator [Flavobacterium sp. MedPE-SWcel]|uniref:GyrI-like domain-containing protein n=1 Tax=uncultured Flavobacterium sp. TaxID=165435 RepID=UPI000915BFB9|nr:effector binding domain-containing protein [uncultured Flavobacterium sp.]OIQ21654.1 MAG: AraC family transcriptional regulator [Flavobacterium sp. MedPE-SWcel]
MDDFKIIGIATETTNANGQSFIDLEKLWGKFWGEDIQSQIPNRVSDDIYAVYTDYESDHTGKYTTIIGLPVSTLETIPEGFVGREITVGKHEKHVTKGKMPEAIGKFWMDLWASGDSNRAYRADVTVHGKKYNDGDAAEVETYISIK